MTAEMIASNTIEMTAEHATNELAAEIATLEAAPAARSKPAMAPRAARKAMATSVAAKAADKPVMAASKAPAAPAPKAPKALGLRAQIEADAAAGKLPTPPNCALESNKQHRPKLALLDGMIAAGDIAGLRAVEIKLVSSTPKALDRYRNLAIVALEARAAKVTKAA